MASTQNGGRSRNPRTVLGGIAKAPQSYATETYRPADVSTGASILFDIGSPDNSSAYSFSFASADLPATQTISVTTDASATAGELAILIHDAIEANSILGSIVSSLDYENAGADLRVTFLRGAAAVAVTATANPSSAVVLTPSAAGSGTEADFGRFLALGDSASWGDNRTLAALTAAAGDSIAVTIVVDSNGDTFLVSVLYEGDFVVATWDADTDTATTVPIAVAAIEAAFPDATVSGVTGTGVITVAFPIGQSATVALETAGGSSTISSVKTDGGDVPSVVFVLDPGDEQPASIGAAVTATPADSPILGLRSLHGEVGVEYPDAAVSMNGTVWVETADGANKGRPYESASASRFALAGAHWIRQDEVDPDLALLYIASI